MTTSTLRLTTAGTSGAWHAQLRDGNRVVADCGHFHRNRRTGNGNADWCGRQLVMAARDDYWAGKVRAAADLAAGRARMLGARTSDAEVQERVEALLATWASAVLAADYELPRPAWATAGPGA